MTLQSHFRIALAILALLFLLPTSASADPIKFSTVRATSFGPGVTTFDLFTNPGVTFTTNDPTIVINVLTRGTLPPGASDTLRLTLRGLGDASGFVVVQDLLLPDPNFPGDPIDDVFRAADFIVPLSYQGITFSLTVDILGVVGDFIIPSGPNAGQVVDSYTYTFTVAQPVPEPATLILLGTGLAGLARVRNRRRAKLPPAG